MFGMKFCSSKKADYRLAVVVIRKVHKSAVVRNRIRRRVFEAVRTLKKADKNNWPYDIVITVYDETAADMPEEKLATNVKKLLAKTF
jgi:ribonuclease P protein component